MTELLIAALIFVLFGLPFLLVLFACIAGARADQLEHSIMQKRLLNAHPYPMSRQVSSNVSYEEMA